MKQAGGSNTATPMRKIQRADLKPRREPTDAQLLAAAKRSASTRAPSAADEEMLARMRARRAALRST